jgi:hypothetical protein
LRIKVVEVQPNQPNLFQQTLLTGVYET